MAPQPRHSSLLAVDVEAYASRTEPGQEAVRRAMYATVRGAAGEAEIPWDECVVQDQGDCILLLVPAHVPVPSLIDPFVARLDGLLRRHNALASAEAAVRMRVAVHAGYVSLDGAGWVGTAVNSTARLLAAPEFKAVLAASRRAQTALIVSDEVYRSIVRQGHVGLDPQSFHQVRVRLKELDTPAWIHVPGYPVPDGLGGAGPDRPAPAPHQPAAAPGQQFGDYAYNKGVIAGGDISVGNDLVIGRD
ncbi:hypothetical protein ABT297_34520 [Dactylosporangium sp. NPDC000555]|uniref:hypothetical protein n=1 Tax=Dactylosporangium sp. NPDC000555 TaxID=3154260 RepID=UPI00332BCC33